MKIIKVTEEAGVTLPEEHLMFQDIFDSFNAPGLWVYTGENQQKGPFGMVQDGHNTILLYDMNESELKWRTIKDAGAYYIEAEYEGEGGVIIPHLAEFEVDIYLDGKKYSILVKCDASSSDALHIALKSTTPLNFFRELNKRIRDIVTTMYIGGELLDNVLVGQDIPLPDDSFQILMKFGMLGLRFESAKILNIVEEATPEDVMKEFEAPISEDEDQFIPDLPQLEEEEETPSYHETPRGPPAVTSLSKSAGKKERSSIPSPSTGSIPSPTAIPSPKVSSEKESKGISAPTPPPVAMPTAAASPPEDVAPRGDDKRSKKKKTKPSLPSLPKTKKERDIEGLIPSGKMGDIMEEEMDVEDMFEEELDVEEDAMVFSEPPMEHAVDDLMPETMDKSYEENILKSIKVRWFDRMVINRTYSVDVTLSSKTLKVQKLSKNIISGESEKEEVSHAVVDLNKPIVIRAIFPGCIVHPMTRRVDPKKETVSVRFYVTPISKGNLDCKILVEQEDIVISEVYTPAKVITHRVSTLISVVGAAVSGIPASLGFVSNGLYGILELRYLYLYGATFFSFLAGAGIYLYRDRKKISDKSHPLSF